MCDLDETIIVALVEDLDAGLVFVGSSGSRGESDVSVVLVMDPFFRELGVTEGELAIGIGELFWYDVTSGERETKLSKRFNGMLESVS